MKIAAVMSSSLLVMMMMTQISQTEEPSWNLHVDLIDGSRLIGVPANKTLKVDVGFDQLEIPLDRVRHADFEDHGRKVRIELTNEDVLTGRMQPESVVMETIFGKVTLHMKQFRSIEVRPKNELGWLPSTRGLALYYSFDRVGDGVVTNLVSDKHVGKLNGSQWTKEGQRGGAIRFNRSSHIEVAHDPDLCPQAITLAAWIKPHGDQSSYQVIVGKTPATSWHGGYAFVRMPGNDKMIHFFVNGYTDSVAKTEIPAEGWSHVAGVCDGRTVTIYLNGKAMDKVPLRGSHRAIPDEETELDSGDFGGEAPPEVVCGVNEPSNQAIRHTDVPLYIGSDARGYAWNGTIDELVLYGRALSTVEIYRLYDASKK